LEEKEEETPTPAVVEKPNVKKITSGKPRMIESKNVVPSKFSKTKKFETAPKNTEEPTLETKPEKPQASKVESVVGALGSLGKSVATKAFDKYNDLYSIHYNLSDDVSVQDLFTSFGGQAALTRLQIQSSEASISFKKFIKSLKPKEASELNKRTKDLDKQFEEENLMENVSLLEVSQIDAQKLPEIADCLERPLEPKPVYARNHFTHLTAVAVQRINIERKVEENFAFITEIISELQLLLSRYETAIPKEEDRQKLLLDAKECIKLITDSSFQLVPIYKYRNYGPT
jgi:hypothetical protein